jgi:hypothetical protein
MVLYTTTYKRFKSYLAQFFLKLNIFLLQTVENLETQILHSMTFFEYRAVYEIR